MGDRPGWETYMLKNLKRFGLRARCIGCDREIRHFQDSGIRLRNKRCSECGSRFRPVWYWKKYPDRALREMQERRLQLMERRLVREAEARSLNPGCTE